MARYKLHQKSFVQAHGDLISVLKEEGAEIDVGPQCPPGPHWEPLDDEARVVVKKYVDNPNLLLPRKVEDMPIHSFTAAPGGIGATKKKG